MRFGLISNIYSLVCFDVTLGGVALLNFRYTFKIKHKRAFNTARVKRSRLD